MADIHGIKWIDTDGVVRSFENIGGDPCVASHDYLYQMSQGNVPGHSPWFKLGYNPDVGTTEEDIWPVGGIYVPPSAEMQMRVLGANASDTSAGTGIRTVRLRYLDDLYAEKYEDITLTGTTPVNTVATDIFRVQSFRALTVGSNGSAVGNVYLQNTGGTTYYGQISAGRTKARTIFYTVPAGKVLYITSVKFSAGSSQSGKHVVFTTKATYDDATASVNTFFMSYHEMGVQDGAFTVDLELPTRFPATVDLKVSAISDSSGAVCTSALRGWLETA
jgi:hypothetical protein